MGERTSIGWTDATFNPWWGCIRVSPGCEHCYAETMAKRYGHAVWGPAKTTGRRMMSASYWKAPVKWNADPAKHHPQAVAEGRRARVFCASMADVFEDHPDLHEPRAQLTLLIEGTPNLDWLLLTKRPENVMRMVPRAWQDGFPPNVWMGTSAEDQRRYDERLPHLLRIPARVRFLSCEPLLGPIDLRMLHRSSGTLLIGELLHWCIIGGESGPGARPCDLRWIRSLVTQCRLLGLVAPFVKQLGARPESIADRISYRGSQTPKPSGFYRHLRDPKGEDWNEWPEDLRVREWPASVERVPA